MTPLEIKNLIEQNKRLEHENRVLKDRIISNVLSENTEIVRLKFKNDQLEQQVRKLSEENMKMKFMQLLIEKKKMAEKL